MIGDDLVNSYHLLLCCLDLIFANAIICPNRRDLLNPLFKGKNLFIFEEGLSVFRKRVLKVDHILFPFSPCCFLYPVKLGLPSDFHTADFRAPEEPPCIIAVLCELHDGLLVEAKGIKEHYFKPYISKLFDRKVLYLLLND